MQRAYLSVGLALSLWLGGANLASAATDPARDAIEAANRAFIGAVLTRNAELVASLYTMDAQVIAPGAAVAAGRTAIEALWQKSIDAGIHELSLSTADVTSTGDLAAETGTVRMVAGDGTVTEARYVVVWKNVDGHWRLYRDIWNGGA